MSAKRDDIERIAKLLNLSGMWRAGKLTTVCPFASKTHSGGTDRNPSFAFMEGSTGHYTYKCLACGESGSVERLYWRMHELGIPRVPHLSLACHGEDEEQAKPKPPLRVLEYAPGGTMVSGPVIADKSFQTEFQLGAPRVKVEKAYFPPDPVRLQKWIDAPIPDYVIERGFAEIHREWKLGHNEQKHRWVHVVRDEHGNTVGYTSRRMWERDYCFRCGEVIVIDGKRIHECDPPCREKHAKYVHHPGQWRRTTLFGIERHVEGAPIVVVEGTTDAMNLERYGVRHACAILGADMSPEQAQLIARRTKQVFSMGDGDMAGRGMNENVRMMLTPLGVAVQPVEVPDGQDPGSLSRDAVVSIFDKLMPLV